jgi:hypothetical protein
MTPDLFAVHGRVDLRQGSAHYVQTATVHVPPRALPVYRRGFQLYIQAARTGRPVLFILEVRYAGPYQRLARSKWYTGVMANTQAKRKREARKSTVVEQIYIANAALLLGDVHLDMFKPLQMPQLIYAPVVNQGERIALDLSTRYADQMWISLAVKLQTEERL